MRRQVTSKGGAGVREECVREMEDVEGVVIGRGERQWCGEGMGARDGGARGGWRGGRGEGGGGEGGVGVGDEAGG